MTIDEFIHDLSLRVRLSESVWYLTLNPRGCIRTHLGVVCHCPLTFLAETEGYSTFATAATKLGITTEDKKLILSAADKLRDHYYNQHLRSRLLAACNLTE